MKKYAYNLYFASAVTSTVSELQVADLLHTFLCHLDCTEDRKFSCLSTIQNCLNLSHIVHHIFATVDM